MRLVRQIVLVTLGLIALVYVGDFVALRVPIPRSRVQFSSVTVRGYYDVTLKDGKSDFYFLDPRQQTCVNSLFPHMGYPPCWYVRRHTHPQIKM